MAWDLFLFGTATINIVHTAMTMETKAGCFQSFYQFSSFHGSLI